MRGYSVVTFALLGATDAAWAANCGGATVCACGDTVTSDYVMSGNLVCSTTPALRWGANDVDIDGNNFSISVNVAGGIAVSTPAAGATNQFTNLSVSNLRVVLNRNGTLGIRVTSGGDVLVNDVTVEESSDYDNSTGVLVGAVSDVTVSNSTFSGLKYAVDSTTGTKARLRIEGNDLSDSELIAVRLRSGIDNALVFTGNDLSGSREGLHINSMVGPWTLDDPMGNLFDDVGHGETLEVIRLTNAQDVTIDGIDVSADPSELLSYHTGVGVRVLGGTDVTLTDIDASGRFRGFRIDSSGTVPVNTFITLDGNDVSDAEEWGMFLQDFDETLVLGDNDFSGSDNGLRIDTLIPTAGRMEIDLSGSTFADIGEVSTGFDQAAVRVVYSENLDIRGLVATLPGDDMGLDLEFNTDITVEQVLICGAGQGIRLDSNTDVVLGGAYPGNVFIESASSAAGAAAIDVDGGNTGIVLRNVLAGGIGTDLSSTSGVTGAPGVLMDVDGDDIPDLCDDQVTTGCVGGDADGDGVCAPVDCDDADPDRFPGNVDVCDGIDNDCVFGPDQAFDPVDADGDGCNDACGSDGPDDDGDGVCDMGDFQIDGAAVLDQSDISAWSTGGVGSPSVIYDEDAGQFVMAFETQIDPADDTCPGGYWALGMATSPDGVSWSVMNGPLLEPSRVANQFDQCVLAHPALVKQGSVTILFFKAEDETTFRGVGRALLQWNGSTYDVTAPDPTLLFPLTTRFGFQHLAFDNASGQYRMAVADFPDIKLTSGSATSFNGLSSAVISSGGGFGPDEVFNPALTCGPSGGYADGEEVLDAGWYTFAGGRTIDPGPPEDVTSAAVARFESSDFATFAQASDVVIDTAGGDPEPRHWDVLPWGVDGYVMWFDDQNGPNGTNQVRVAHTGAGSWGANRAALVANKVCIP